MCREQACAMDAQDFHSFACRTDSPAETLSYRRGDRVLVWTSTTRGVAGFVRATVMTQDADGEFVVDAEVEARSKVLRFRDCLPLQPGTFSLGEDLNLWGASISPHRHVFVVSLQMLDLDLITRWWIAIAALIFSIDRLTNSRLEERVKSIVGPIAGGNAMTFLYAGTLICSAFALKDLWQGSGGGGGGGY